MDQGQISFDHEALGKLSGEKIENPALTTEKDGAAGQFVQPMDRVEAIPSIIGQGLGHFWVG
jgi:hypothetical protein